jgi:ssDNA thymidine ADP-ribosyltransferase, DarT
LAGGSYPLWLPIVALPELTAENAYIFRITHRNNLLWILENGLHSRKSKLQDPNFVNIGMADLIEKRHQQKVTQPPGGTLSDYIPFYFTPRSMMAYNIYTGRNVKQRDNTEIVILVTSLRKLQEEGLLFLFTDRHASAVGAKFSSNLDHLERVDWKILQNSDFSRDNDDLEKTNRYQAEALAYREMSTEVLLNVACCDDNQKAWAEGLIAKQGVNLKVLTKRGWYF